MKKNRLLLAGILAAVCLLAACAELQEQIGSIKITESVRQELQRTGQALRNSFSISSILTLLGKFTVWEIALSVYF